MELPQNHEITRILQAWGAKDQDALRRLIPLVYQDLHRAAHWCMSQEQPGNILQSTALINEAYLRLVEMGEVN